MTSENKPELSAALAEYLEAIYTLSQRQQAVRITDIALYLKTSKPSVNRAVNALVNLGCAEHEPYGDILLTDAGKDFAARVSMRRSIISAFLTNTLGVPPERAFKEAGYISHGISSETVDKMAELKTAL